MGLTDWLAKKSMQDLDEWVRRNPTYESLSEPPSAEESLFYINLKLRHANDVLGKIHSALVMILAMVALLVGEHFGVWAAARRWLGF